MATSSSSDDTRHRLFRGIRQRGASGYWVCEVRNPNKIPTKIWLGSHPTPEMAARARDVAEIAYRGARARLNFEDSRWLLPIPASNDINDVKKAAAEAAEAFRPRAVTAANMENEVPTTSASIDDEVFSSHEVELDDMAQGMMIAPPPWHTEYMEEVETVITSLWSFSV